MPVATEIAVLSLQPGVDVHDASSPGGQKLKALQSEVATKKGYIGQYWGTQVENPSKFVWTIDWNDVSDHHAYMQSDEYKEFIAEASKVFDFAAGAAMGHANFTADAAKVREAPVTEFASFMVPKSTSEEKKTELEDATLKLTHFCTTEGTSTGFATGWVMEESDHEKGSDGKALTLSALIGWPSVEAHMKLRETKEFVDTATPLRAMVLPPTPEKAMFHATLVKF